jgi:hypothetical protein
VCFSFLFFLVVDDCGAQQFDESVFEIDRTYLNKARSTVEINKHIQAELNRSEELMEKILAVIKEQFDKTIFDGIYIEQQLWLEYREKHIAILFPIVEINGDKNIFWGTSEFYFKTLEKTGMNLARAKFLSRWIDNSVDYGMYGIKNLEQEKKYFYPMP